MAKPLFFAFTTAVADSPARSARYDAAGVPLGEYDAAEGWRIIEGMRGGCYCDLSLAVCIVARHPCWTRGTK
jgi:hypothetical protein